MSEVLKVTLEALQTRVTRVFPAQVRSAVESLTDEQIWWRPNEASNSVGNLVLHLTGSLNYFLNRNLGRIEFTRDRPAEFAERGPVPKDQLMAGFNDMVAKAERTFDALTTDGLGDRSPEPSMHRLVIEDLINASMHLANHTGQIVWIAKMLKSDAVHEVWIKSHKAEGAWKQA